MKDETAPVSPDELVIRLIWTDFYRPENEKPVRERAFLPRPNDAEGISVYRAACLEDPREALKAIVPEKRGKYAVALLPVAEMISMGLTIQPSKDVDVPGHAVIPELNFMLISTDEDRCLDIQKRLAALAAKNLIPPTDSVSG